MSALRHIATTVAALAVLGVVGAPATAATCTDKTISARGDPSRFEVLAKAKARGNWRAKVRATPALGAPYADWGKAWAGHYRCSQRASKYVCFAVAHPCRD